MNNQILEIYPNKFKQDLAKFYDNIKQFLPIIKIQIDSFITNEHFQDYLQNFIKEPFNIIFMILSLIYLIGLVNYKYEFYFPITVINTFILFIAFFLNFVVYLLNKHYNNQYNWSVYIFIVPFCLIMINNINVQFNYPKNIKFISKSELDLNTNELDYNENNYINLNQDEQEFIEDEYIEDEQEYIDEDEQEYIDEDEQEEWEDYKYEFYKDYKENEEDLIDKIQDTEKYLKQYVLSKELNEYVMNNIQVYKKCVISNIRITEDDTWEIRNIFGNKISNRELRTLIRTINQIIQKKIV